MPFFPPFFYNPYNTSSYATQKINPTYNSTSSDSTIKKNNSEKKDSPKPYFFELFGLQLFFDDILLMCLIFFLYEEGIKDDELFISLILLLLS